MTNAIDIFVWIVLAAGLLTGLAQGFVKQACAVIGLVAGLLIARALYTMVGEELTPHIGTSVTFAQIISFIVIWAIVPLILTMAGTALTKALEAVCLGTVNRLLGGVAGIVLNILFLGLLVTVLEYIDPDDKLISTSMKKESAFYHPLGEVTGIFVPVVKDITHQIMK